MNASVTVDAVYVGDTPAAYSNGDPAQLNLTSVAAAPVQVVRMVREGD